MTSIGVERISHDLDLLWFRRQLRVDDQPLLRACANRVVGVWVLDPRELLATDPLGFYRCGDHRLKFILASVAELRASLRGLGSDLIVRQGEPEAVLPALMKELSASRLRAIREPGTEERAIEQRLETAMRVSGRSDAIELLEPESLFELPDPTAMAEALPDVFTRWRRKIEKRHELGLPVDPPSMLTGPAVLFDPGELPSLSSLGRDDPPDDPRAVMKFVGGESAGQARMASWMFEDDRLRRYKQTRNGLLGEAYSSKLSPWLSLGCLSSRRVAAATLDYEAQRVANESTYWLRFELFWREYFRLYLLKHGATLFHAGGPQGLDLDWSNPPGFFEAWCTGRTGVPFVDANMIELAATGFMSNRGRQNVASFLAKNLDVDWRWGARWFESQLIDACPAANWGNWAYVAGVGCDPRGFRGFDIEGQAWTYDRRGAYVEHWLADEAGRTALRPIVEVKASLRAARDRWQAAITKM